MGQGPMLSLATDYATSKGCPEPALRAIAHAGFSHVHWCFHWDSDFLYHECEIEAIRRWLDDYGLAVPDMHGSSGQEKVWCSAVEYERLAGVELVKNRIGFAASLGADAVAMHIPTEPDEVGQRDLYWARLRKTFDAIEPFARERGVRIAIENLGNNNFDTIERAFEFYGPDYVGLCYDSGHGNMTGNGLDRLDGMKDRLVVVHLHDNHGEEDEHLRPFLGTVDWERLAALIAASAYDKPISMEISQPRHPGEEEDEFLAKCYAAGTQFAQMVERHRDA